MTILAALAGLLRAHWLPVVGAALISLGLMALYKAGISAGEAERARQETETLKRIEDARREADIDADLGNAADRLRQEWQRR